MLNFLVTPVNIGFTPNDGTVVFGGLACPGQSIIGFNISIPHDGSEPPKLFMEYRARTSIEKLTIGTIADMASAMEWVAETNKKYK